ncbi:MAG: FAD-dependent oxidoreductase [Deltaproteobacteria bacterium]|nr:FAD-dependent oxidoreductase [Deltaproteobacteria bacterium]
MTKKIFEPFEINGMVLKNRLGFPPFLNMPAEEDCTINDQTVRWFEDRARGGAGLVMTGAVLVGPEPDYAMLKMLDMTRVGLFDDKFVDGFVRIADAVHAHGAKFGVQLEGLGGVMSGKGPSLPPYPDAEDATDGFLKIIYNFDVPITEVTIEELEAVKQSFADAAGRAKKAGADCVELHCAHGGATLNCSFISPYYNRRTDQYGGSWENRLRLSTEIIQGIRKVVGDDFPILARISSDQLVGEKGITLADTIKYVVPALEKAGIDCFDVTQGDMTRSQQGIIIPMYYKRGCFMDMTAEVKKATNLPVIGVGRIVDIDMANQFVEDGKADLIFMGRQFTADPDTPNKYLAGKADEIRKCIACNMACGPCPINYEIHRDHIPLTQAEIAKKVLVIGGGVAGMEAARIASLRGHQVTLMEKSDRLGGLVTSLAKTPMTGEFGNLVEFLSTQMEKRNVDVKMNQEAGLVEVEALQPDVVLLSTGSTMQIPAEAKSQPSVMDHIDALERMDEIGQKVVIWGLVAADFAISLANAGKDVVLMGRGGVETLAKYYPSGRRFFILRQLTDVRLPRVTPEGARLSNPEVLYQITVEDIANNEIKTVNNEGTQRAIPYDTLIISRERTPNDQLFEALQGKVAEVHKIGDCSSIEEIQEAILSANEITRKL